MAQLRKQLATTSGVDVGGNEFTLQETDIAPYIENPDLAQMEADVTKARYGGKAIQDDPLAEARAPYEKPEGNVESMDFSRRADFEQSVFKQLKGELNPSGNPFEFNTVAAMNALTKQDMPELFKKSFKGQVDWEDRHLLNDDQKKYWTEETKRYRAHIKEQLDAEKKMKVDLYNNLMNRFDNQAKERAAAMKLVQQKTKEFTASQQKGEKEKSAMMKRRTELIKDMRILTQKVFEAETTKPLNDEEAEAFRNQMQAIRDELQMVSSKLNLPKSEKEKRQAAQQVDVSKHETTKLARKGEKKKATPTTVTKEKRIVRTGIRNGRKVVQYEDGSVEYVS